MAKRHVSKLVLRAKVAYFNTKRIQCSSPKQLFHVTSQLADRRTPQGFYTCHPLVELPRRFADFSWTKSEQYGITRTVKYHSLAPPNQSKRISFLSHFHAFKL